jgi:hypothetical protein
MGHGADEGFAIGAKKEVVDNAVVCLDFLIRSRALVRIDEFKEEEITAEDNKTAYMGNPTSCSSFSSFASSRIEVTRYGRAVVEGMMNPDEAVVIYEDLFRALSFLHLDGNLHLSYLITPLQHNISPDFAKLWRW